MIQSTASEKPIKPAKPRLDFPLYAHGVGQWAKRILGKVYYFGAWAAPDEAEAKYETEKADLHALR